MVSKIGPVTLIGHRINSVKICNATMKIVNSTGKKRERNLFSVF